MKLRPHSVACPERRAVIARRKLERDYANQRELTRRTLENRMRLEARMRAGSAKKPFVSPQRDPLVDRDIFREIQHLLDQQDKVRLTGRRPPPVIQEKGTSPPLTREKILKREERLRIKAALPIQTTLRQHPIYEHVWDILVSQAKARRKRGECDYTFWVPRWEDTGAHLKMLAWTMVCYKEYGYALTVNISPEVLAGAEADRRNSAAEHIRDRVRRELRTACRSKGLSIPEFFFAVEAPSYGDPHLHGGITGPLTKEHRAVVREALFRAGWGTNAKRTGREVDLQELRTPAYWAYYCTKWWRSSNYDEGRVFAASNGLRSKAAAWYKTMRRSGALLPGHLYKRNADLLSISSDTRPEAKAYLTRMDFYER